MTIFERGVEWVRGVGREFKTGEFADGISVSSTKASQTLARLERDAHVRRVGFGRYAPSGLSTASVQDARLPAASLLEANSVDFNELARDVQSEEAEVARLQGELWQAEARRAKAVQRLERALLTRRPASTSGQCVSGEASTVSSAGLCSTVSD